MCSIVVRVPRNRKVFRSTLNQIADTLRIERSEIERWLEKGTYEELVAHLERYPAEVLESLAIERRFREFDKSS
jgi:DNA-binding transcriptional regulator LsrR (DeoR family)